MVFALLAGSPPLIVLVAVVCAALGALATAFVRTVKHVMPQESSDRVKIWAMWLEHRRRRAGPVPMQPQALARGVRPPAGPRAVSGCHGADESR
jgi:hypothetical protein